MDEFIMTTVILVGLCSLFATLLAFAYKKLRVYEDPRIDHVEERLPGANCGACGEPGCRAFAEKVVAGNINPGACTVSPEEGVQRIADYLGIEPSRETKRVARLLCAGGKSEAQNLSEYKGGMATCRGETVVAGGPKECSWGCLGLGDCETACTFGAITMSADGLPVVDASKCTACNDCVEVCPKQLFTLMPVTQKLLVQCRSLLDGDLAETKCSVACTACGRCAADAAPGLITMENNLAVIHYELNAIATPHAVKRCPTNAIVWLTGEDQFVPKSTSHSLPLGRVASGINLEDIYYQ